MKLFPAQAGVIHVDFKAGTIHIAVPRASGGDPYNITDKGRGRRCSPRKRG